jgi:putative nucleotidyltransferase with HDIG domain
LAAPFGYIAPYDEEVLYMTRDEALALVREYVKNEGLIRHMYCVEACLRLYAEKFREDPEAWGLLGLLHDFDWEIHPTLEEHPVKGAPILRERGVPEDIIQDILSHGVGMPGQAGYVPRDTLRRKALYACDEITGLVTAVALVRPSRSLLDLEPSSVRKKWKDKAFAAGTDRAEMEEAARDFGIELWEHTGNVIAAMRRIAPELGLVGNVQNS